MANTVSEHALNLAIIIKEAAPYILERFRNEFKKLSGAVEWVAKATKNWGQVLKQEIIPNVLIVLAGTLLTVAKQVITLDDQIARLGLQFGMTRKEIKDFNDGLYGVAVEAGVLPDQLASVARALMEANFKGTTKDLLELSATVYKFTEVTGISYEETARFAGELAKLGISSQKLLNDLGGMRSVLQLSSKEFQTVMDITKSATESMYAFGNTTKNITQNELDDFGKAIATIAGSLQHLGLSAESTTRLLKGMTDPIEYLNNPKLMVAMGVSWDDMEARVMGAVDAQQMSLNTMLKIRDKLQQFTTGGMGNLIIGAKVTGFSPAEIMRMGRATDEQIIKDWKMRQEQIELKKLWDDMGASITHLQRAFAKTFGALYAVMEPSVEMVSGFLDEITKVIQAITGVFGKSQQLGNFLKIFFAPVMTLIIGGFTVFVAKIYQGTMGLMAMGTQFGVLAAQATGATAAIERFSIASMAGMAARGIGGGGGGVNAVNWTTNASAGSAAAGAAAAVAMAAGQQGEQATEVITQQVAQQGKTAGQGWMKNFVGFLKSNLGRGMMGIMGGINMAIPIMGAINKKNFTVADLSQTLTGLGMMLMVVPGLQGLGAVLMGIGMAGSLMSALFPKFGAAGISWGKTEAMANKVDNNIPQLQADMIDVASLRQELKLEQQSKHLAEIEKHTKETWQKINEGNKQSNVQHRENSTKQREYATIDNNIGWQTRGQ